MHMVYPIIVNHFASNFNCTPIGRASDSKMDPTLGIHFSRLGHGPCLVCCLVVWGLNGAFLSFRYFCGIFRHPRDLRVFLLNPHL